MPRYICVIVWLDMYQTSRIIRRTGQSIGTDIFLFLQPGRIVQADAALARALVQVNDWIISIKAVMPFSGNCISILEESVVVSATLSRHDIDDPGVHVSVFGFWNTGYHRDFLDRCAVHTREHICRAAVIIHHPHTVNSIGE